LNFKRIPNSIAYDGVTNTLSAKPSFIPSVPLFSKRSQFSKSNVSQMPQNVAIRGPLDDLLVFHELARSLTSTLDLTAILRAIRAHMEQFIEADFWALLMVEPNRQYLYYVSADGNEDPRLSDMRVKVGEGLAGWVALHGETLLIPEAATDPRLAAAATSGSGFAVHSAIGLPIRGRKETHGVLAIFNPHLEKQSDYTIAFLHILVDYAAIAIENAQEVARAQQLTITDDVTGLYNSRHLYSELERELEVARSGAKPLSLVFLDLDRFKHVNDHYGHLVGSELLGQVGKRVRELCRPSDLCFRFGGDEFVILMPGTTREEAFRMTQSIHLNLAKTIFTLGHGLELTVEASAGIAAYPGDGRTVHAILGAADKRMYHVKSSGRGRVEA
jgi:diguanylate cyclase (GGDEF)-like protein